MDIYLIRFLIRFLGQSLYISFVPLMILFKYIKSESINKMFNLSSECIKYADLLLVFSFIYETVNGALRGFEY